MDAIIEALAAVLGSGVKNDPDVSICPLLQNSEVR